MDKLLLIGAGGHCQSCIEVIEQNNKYLIAGIVDPFITDKKKFGYKIFHNEDFANYFKSVKFAFITLGLIKKSDIKKREKYFYNLKQIGFKFPVIKAKTSYVSKNTKINEGTVIHHNVFINSGTNIGSNSIINTGSIIEHDTIIGNNTHISTGVIINGNCKIGDNSFIGSGSVIPNNISLKDRSFKRAFKLITNKK